MADNRINIVIQTTDKSSGAIKASKDAIDDLGRSSDQAASKTAAFSVSGETAFRAIRTAALAGGAAFVAASGYAITSAADYQQSMNVFQSVSGATAAQMAQVAATARQLGQDVSLPGISAKDAAFAMVELSKAGLSVNDTLSASKGVLALAKAGNLDTAQAAEIAANALNAFRLSGDQATRVADLLAASANASSADVTDMAYALQMSSASAAAVKVPVEDLSTAIAEMANNGIKGSDAGTSLKTMFMNLIPQTDDAREAFHNMNLDFYDAQGNFVGMRAAIDQLQKGTAKMTDEQKAYNIQQAFGTDSSRAVNILLKEGVAGYDKLKGAVTKAGAATELATAQNSGFKGALDNLQSSLETVAIDVGTQLLPKLTQLIQTVGPGLTQAFSTAGNGLVGLVNGFPAFWDQATRVTGILPGLAASLVVYQVATTGVQMATTAWAAAQAALNAVLLVNPFILAATAAAGIITAYAMVTANSDSATNAQNRLKAANDQLAAAADANKAAQDRLRGSLLDQEGANLRVESAQRNYNNAVAEYGPKSFEARQAEYDLKRAHDDAARAASAVAANTRDARNANNELAAAKENVKRANAEIAASAYSARDGFSAMANAARQATEEAQRGNSAKANQTIINSLKIPLAGQHASGTPYAAGGLTLVGERGPELVNLPSGSSVTQNWKTREMGADGGLGGGATTVQIYGDISIATPEAATTFWDRVDQSHRLSRMGTGMVAA